MRGEHPFSSHTHTRARAFAHTLSQKNCFCPLAGLFSGLFAVNLRRSRTVPRARCCCLCDVLQGCCSSSNLRPNCFLFFFCSRLEHLTRLVKHSAVRLSKPGWPPFKNTAKQRHKASLCPLKLRSVCARSETFTPAAISCRLVKTQCLGSDFFSEN